MVKKKRINQVITTDYVDEKSGALVAQSSEVKSVSVETEPPFIKLYTQDIGRLYGLTESSNKVLMILAKYMTYKSNVVVLYGPIKDMMMSELGMNRNTFNKAIDTLYKSGFLIRKARACYVLDPTIFGTGSWADVRSVRLSIEYHSDGTKAIKTDLVRDNAIEVIGRGKSQEQQLPFAEEVEDGNE